MAGGCSGCAQRAAAREAYQQAMTANRPSAPRAQYTVIDPQGGTKTFTHEEYGSDAYLQAVTYKRQVNGTLTTQ